MKFSVLSYNILAQKLINRKAFPHVPSNSTILKKKNRQMMILSKIEQKSADIVCLQEVDFYTDFLEPKMKALGYDSVYMRKPSLKIPKSDVDGCATFWKREKFFLDCRKGIDFNACMADLSATNNVGLVLGLNSKASNHRILVANCHLYWRQQSELLRLRQIEFLIRQIATLNPDKSGVLVCGDFNASPQSQSYQLITEKQLDHLDIEKLSTIDFGKGLCPNPLFSNSAYAQTADIFENGILTESLDFIADPVPGPNVQQIVDAFNRSPLSFSSSYRVANGIEPKYTNATTKFTGTLDYIFATSKYLRVEGVASLPECGTFLPSQDEPSDHLPIMGTFHAL